MSPLTLKQVLIGGRDFLKQPRHWIRWGYIRHNKNAEVNGACSVGAIMHVIDPDVTVPGDLHGRDWQLYNEATDLLRAFTPGDSIVGFNDRLAT